MIAPQRSMSEFSQMAGGLEMRDSCRFGNDPCAASRQFLMQIYLNIFLDIKTGYVGKRGCGQIETLKLNKRLSRSFVAEYITQSYEWCLSSSS
mmetsp:Transcript_9169/g.15712  ORF Transcript_9169/g.15712 Transcript_9169/m.15712 type:complete len:93 (-) Transcript_9169:370-648(-)